MINLTRLEEGFLWKAARYIARTDLMQVSSFRFSAIVLELRGRVRANGSSARQQCAFFWTNAVGSCSSFYLFCICLFLESLHERLPLSTPAVSNTTVCREVSFDQMSSQQNPCPLFLWLSILACDPIHPREFLLTFSVSEHTCCVACSIHPVNIDCTSRPFASSYAHSISQASQMV